MEPLRENELTLVLLLDKIPHVTWRDFAEEFNIIVRMELCHFALGRRLSTLKKTTPDESEEEHHGSSDENKTLPRSLTNISILLYSP